MDFQTSQKWAVWWKRTKDVIMVASDKRGEDRHANEPKNLTWIWNDAIFNPRGIQP